MNWFLFVFFLFAFYAQTFSERVHVKIDTEKWTQIVPPGFLSVTVDPVTLLLAGPLQGPTIEMAKALSPAFVRICGEGTDLLQFGEELFKNNTSFTDMEIDSVMQFANNADLHVIVGLNPTKKSDGYWNSDNSLKIISYMNNKGYKASWQLGRDLNIPHLSGVHLATDILKLKTIVDSFPLFSKSLVLGPDFKNSENEIFKDFLQHSGNSISSVIILLKPQSYNDLEKHIKNLVINFENSVGNHNVDQKAKMFRKSLFLADAVASEGTFEQAKQLARTLGTAAALGCKMFFRKTGKISLTTPTPEFWFSALYKALVGRYVFNTQFLSNNNLHVYSQCTPTLRSQILDRHYTNGSLTIFGINDSPDVVELEIKDIPKEGPMHVFSLTTQLHGIKEVTLLNGRELSMLETKLPLLAPTVKKGSFAHIPRNSIFFIVLPDMRLKACTDSKSMTKREIIVKRPEIKQINLTELNQKYRNFAKNIYNRMLQDSGLIQEKKDDTTTSFITYNNNGWLNDLLNHILPIDNRDNHVEVQSASTDDSQKDRPKRSVETVDKENENFPIGNLNEDNTLLNRVVEDTQNSSEDDQMPIEKLNQPIEGMIHNDGTALEEDEDQKWIGQTIFNIANQEEKLLNASSQFQLQSEGSQALSREETKNNADSSNEGLVRENEDVPYAPTPAYSQPISNIGKDKTTENIYSYDFIQIPNLKTSYIVNPQHVVSQEPPMIPQYLPKHLSNPNFIKSHTPYPTQTSELVLNENKENAINSILTKIISKENALFENEPVNPSKEGTIKEMDANPLMQVIVPGTDLDVPLNSIDTEDEDAQQTLSPGDNLILPSNDRPTVKVQRQIHIDPLYKNSPAKTVQNNLLDIFNKFPRQPPIMMLSDLPEPNESNRNKAQHLGWPKKEAQPLPMSPAQLPEMNDPLYTNKLAEAVRLFIEQKKMEYEAIKAKMTSVRQKVLESSTNVINNEKLSKNVKQRSEEIKTILKQLEPDGISSKIPIPLYIPSIRAKRSVKEHSLSDDSKLKISAKQSNTHKRMKRSFSEELDKLIEKAQSWFEDINPFSSSKRSKRNPIIENSVRFSDNDLKNHDNQDNSIKFSQNSEEDKGINRRLIKDYFLKKIKGNVGMYEFAKKFTEVLENAKKTEQIPDSISSDFQTSSAENTKDWNGILGKADPCKDSSQIDGSNENSNKKDIAIVEFAVSSNGPKDIENETFVKQLFQGMVVFFSKLKHLMEN